MRYFSKIGDAFLFLVFGSLSEGEIDLIRRDEKEPYNNHVYLKTCNGLQHFVFHDVQIQGMYVGQRLAIRKKPLCPYLVIMN
ncbi:MAG: hypothetical protein HY514_01370 [Candidatus Aenigmarchaeota archaeon]|nr:hypothetical protein [Candidatus Aenigmarchaeota archaeon]